MSNKNTDIFTHSFGDYVSRLEDVLYDAIRETEINVKGLASYRSWSTGTEGDYEYDYDESEAYPHQLSAFKDELAVKGWYYVLCLGTKAAKKWEKATRNPRLYNKVNAVIWKVLEENF